MKLTNILKKLHKKVTGIDIEKGNVTDILESMEENYAAQPGGGSEPTYKTVAEIPVGTMVENHGLYMFQPSDSIPLARNETLFFNSEEYPLEYAEEGTIYYYNLDPSTGVPTGTPAYAVFLDGTSINGLFSDTDLSNTTVRILKKVEQGGDELPEVTSADNGDVLTVVDGAWAKAEPSGNSEYIITGDFAPTMNASGAITAIAWNNIYISSVDEVNAAIEAGQHVVLRGSFSPQTGVNLFFDFPMSSRTTVSDEVDSKMSDSFYFSGEIVLIGNKGDGFVPDVYNVASILGQGDGSIYVMSAIKPQNIDHYEFVYTLAPNGEGGYTATPNTGATYANIKAALAETPNVYVRGILGTDNLTIGDYINGENYISFCGSFRLESIGWCVIRLWINEDNTSSVVIDRLVIQ